MNRRFSPLEVYIFLYIITNYEFRFFDFGFYARHLGKTDGTIEYDNETKQLTFTNNPF
jgi:hypothetical protein